MTKALFLLTALAVATPLAAQTPTTQPQPIVVAGNKGPDAQKLVCKTEDTIGSRLGAKKVCLTVQEWKERADFYRDQTESWQRQAPARASGG
jgi:hypothetical protein